MAERTVRVGQMGGSGSAPRWDEDADADGGGGRRRGHGLAAILMLAASGLLVYVVWSIMWERSHPASESARLVHQGDGAARLKVIRALERIGPEDPDIALPALTQALADPEIANRAAAIEGLLTVIQYVGPNGSSPEGVGLAMAAVMDRLDDPRPEIRRRSVQAIWTIVLIWQGAPHVLALDRAVAAMTRIADDRDPEIRVAAVRGLGAIGRRVADEPPPRLLAALDDDSEVIRSAAAQSLCTYRGGLARMLPALVKAIGSTRPECRPAYLRVMGEIRPDIHDGPPTEDLVRAMTSALSTPDREVRRRIVQALGTFRDRARDAIPALVAILSRRGEDESLQRTGVGGRPGREDDPPPEDIVVAAVEALGAIAGAGGAEDDGRGAAVPPVPEVVAALGPLLRSQSAARRAAAIEALLRFAPDPALVNALGEAVADADPSVRIAALGTLRYYADDAALEIAAPQTVPRALEDDDPRVRLAAAGALGSFRSGVEPMVPSLIRHAGHDPEAQVRRACCISLKLLGPPAVTAAVVPRYIEAIESADSPSDLLEGLIEGLRPFEKSAQAAIPAIVRTMRTAEAKSHSPEPEIHALRLRDTAARTLGRLAPGTPFAGEAVAALAGLLGQRGVPIADSLGAFGSAARVSAPALLGELRRARDRRSATAVAAFATAIERVAAGSPEADEALSILTEYIARMDRDDPSGHELVAAVARFGVGVTPALPRLRENGVSAAPQVEDADRKAVSEVGSSGR